MYIYIYIYIRIYTYIFSYTCIYIYKYSCPPSSNSWWGNYQPTIIHVAGACEVTGPAHKKP